MSDGTLWKIVGDQVTPRPLNTDVFGTARSIPAPQTNGVHAGRQLRADFLSGTAQRSSIGAADGRFCGRAQRDFPR